MKTKYYTICQNNVEGYYKRNDEIDIYISLFQRKKYLE